MDDSDDRVFINTTTTDYSLKYGEQLRYVYDNYKENELETVLTDVEGQSNYDDIFSWERTVWTAKKWDRNDQSYNYYTLYYDRIENFSLTYKQVITYELGAEQLQSLSDDGVLNFSLTATAGDLIYVGGSLTVEINENPVQETTHTPEPTAMILFGFGLLSLAGAARKRTG